MPEPRLVDLFALSPTHWAQCTALLAAFASSCALLRTALMLEAVLSRGVRLAIRVLSILPSPVVAAVLVLSAARYPTRAWMNLGLATIVLMAWYAGALLPRLVRPDVDRDDTRSVLLGACIALATGLVAALVVG